MNIKLKREHVRLEREHQQRQSFSNGHVDETLDSEIQSRLSAEASIKSTMQLFVKFSAEIILDSWSETNRYVNDFIFCCMCPNALSNCDMACFKMVL